MDGLSELLLKVFMNHLLIFVNYNNILDTLQNHGIM